MGLPWCSVPGSWWPPSPGPCLDSTQRDEETFQESLGTTMETTTTTSTLSQPATTLITIKAGILQVAQESCPVQQKSCSIASTLSRPGSATWTSRMSPAD